MDRNAARKDVAKAAEIINCDFLYRRHLHTPPEAYLYGVRHTPFVPDSDET